MLRCHGLSMLNRNLPRHLGWFFQTCNSAPYYPGLYTLICWICVWPNDILYLSIFICSGRRMSPGKWGKRHCDAHNCMKCTLLIIIYIYGHLIYSYLCNVMWQNSLQPNVRPCHVSCVVQKTTHCEANSMFFHELFHLYTNMNSNIIE